MGKVSDRILNKNRKKDDILDSLRSKATRTLDSFTIRREDIEKFDFSICDQINTMALEGKTNRHLFVSGYNTDPRELWQIPEVKVYFRELVWKALITLYFHPASIQLIYQINYHKGVPLEILPEDYKHFVYGQFKVQNDLMEETHPDFEKTVKQIVDRTQQAFNLDLTTPEKAVAAMSV